MAFRQIANVDVIADARAIDGRVIIAINAQSLKLSDRDLGDIRHQIVRDAVRILPEEAGWMGSDGVEVTEKGNIQRGIRMMGVFENPLDHDFGLTIRIRRAFDGVTFRKRDAIGDAINGRR